MNDNVIPEEVTIRALDKPARDAPAAGRGTAFFVDGLVGETMFLLQRRPHRYGFAYGAMGTAPGLQVFAGTSFPEVQQSDGFDVADAGLAMTRCVFELLERTWSPVFHSSLTPPLSRAQVGVEYGTDVADPSDFALLSDQERDRLDDKFRPYRPDTPLHWIKGWCVMSENGAMIPAMLPAVLVHPGFGVAHPEDRICPMLSPGLAAGRTADEAVLNGLCEVIERDAAAAGWLVRAPGRRLPMDLVTEPQKSALSAVAADGFDIALFECTLDIPVPVVLAVIRNDRRSEAFAAALGLGCHPDRRIAAAKAFSEALYVMFAHFDFPSGTDIVRRDGNTLPVIDGVNQRDALDRYFSAALPEDAGAQDTLEGADRPVEADPGRLVAHILKTLLVRDHQVYIADLTPEAATHFRLVRVLISGMQPMLYERSARRLANPRLLALPERLGLPGQITSELDLDLSPHPFTYHEMA